jgi:hypothetical protein
VYTSHIHSLICSNIQILKWMWYLERCRGSSAALRGSTCSRFTAQVFLFEYTTLQLIQNVSGMSKQKHTKKGDKKHERRGSDDEFALDLVDDDAPKTKSSKKVIDDSDVDGVDAQYSAQPRSKEPVTHPCKSCQLQLQVEVDAKLQARTLSAKASETLQMLPYCTAEELVDIIVDLASAPSSGSAAVTSPSPKVHIGDGDRNWQVMKFPDIGFFAGTTLEKSVEAWWIPKVPVLYNTVTEIPGCANCRLQSVASVSGVSKCSVR